MRRKQKIMNLCRPFPCLSFGLLIILRLGLHLNQENDSKFIGLPDTFYNILKLSASVADSDSLPSDPSHFFVWMRSSRHRLLKYVPLSYTAKSHQMTLLLISGLHPNPGPRRPRFPCGVCTYACKTGVIACDECGQWMHKECIGMSTTLFTRLGDSSAPWTCPQCNVVNTSSKSYSIPTKPEEIGHNSSTTKSPQRNSANQSSQAKPNRSSSLSSVQDSSIPGTTTSFSTRSIDSDIHPLDLGHMPQHTSSPKKQSDSKKPDKDSLRILSINFRSLRKKGLLLEAVIDDYDPDIILGNETWLDSNIHSSEILPPYLGYEINRRDSKTGPYDGVMIATKKNLQISDIKCSENVELISGTINLAQKKKLHIASFYRPPKCKGNEYTDQATLELKEIKMKAKGNTVIFGGDFNLPDISWETNSIVGSQYPKSMNSKYLDMIAECSLEQIVDFETRSKSKNILDLILTSHPGLKQRCKPLPSIGNSDHDIVLYDCAVKPFRPKPVRRKIYLWNKANIEGIKEDLVEFGSAPPPPDKNVLELWDMFKIKIEEVIANRVPTKMSSNRHTNPWINTEIRRCIRRKQRAHKKSKATKKKKDNDRYLRLQTEVNFLIQEAHKTYLEDIVSNDCKSNNKKFWSYIKSKGQDSAGVPPLKDRDGFLYSSSSKKAEILNNQFLSAFTAEDTSNIPSKGASPFPAMSNIQVSVGGVKNLLMNLEIKKATGPDFIPAFILKTAANEISPFLTSLFQLSLDSGVVPPDWRQAWIVPIYKKKGEKHLAQNYRPVSLTSITCKILEHIVHSSVMRHFDNHKILTDSQHGFRKSRSCETQLILTTHEIAKHLSTGTQVDVQLLDFSKAFDKVPYNRLISKLNFYGVRDNTLQWITAFLKHRKQRVQLEGILSSEVDVVSGVPQGTVLGPLLFLAFINDLPDSIKHSSTKLFADDCMLFRPIKNDADCTLLQQDLSSLEKWEKQWQMEFNPGKCTVMKITPSKQKEPISFDYFLHNQRLTETKSSKYLGVTFHHDLSWSEHINNTATKGNKTLGFLRRNFRRCTPSVKATTYKTMVRPILDYASTVWDPAEGNTGDAGLLERVQRRAARFVFNNYSDRNPGCVTNMLNKLDWESLSNRRANSRLIMLYRFLNSNELKDSIHFLKKSDTRTRGRDRLYQDHSKHPALHHSFFPRTIREWNKLPTSLTGAPSLDLFKAHLGSTISLGHQF